MKLKALLYFALAVCFSQIVVGQEVPINTQPERGYLVGPGDEITGKVLGEPQFDFVATIDENGKFQVPFFENPINAKCRTQDELNSDVKKLLSRYLKNPQISVQVTKRKSRPPATIYGEVSQPQQVELRREARLRELIAFAGGPTDKAGGVIQVVHTQPLMCSETNEANAADNVDNVSKTYSLNSLRAGHEASNPLVHPGDIIVVGKAPPVYVIGEVNALREITMPESGLSLTEALAQAGGVSRQAKTKNIAIQRLKPNSKEREVISVNYDKIKKGEQKDVLLMPEDIVVVDKAKKSVAQTILEIATGSARSFSQVLPQRVLY